MADLKCFLNENRDCNDFCVARQGTACALIDVAKIGVTALVKHITPKEVVVHPKSVPAPEIR